MNFKQFSFSSPKLYQVIRTGTHRNFLPVVSCQCSKELYCPFMYAFTYTKKEERIAALFTSCIRTALYITLMNEDRRKDRSEGKTRNKT